MAQPLRAVLSHIARHDPLGRSVAERPPAVGDGGTFAMKVALFIPCYVDAFFPEVGIATLELLERLGCEVDYPLDQTCCGQPMANSGCQDDARATEALFASNFAGYDHIVTPSGSCAHHVRDQLTAIAQTPAVQAVRRNTLRAGRVPARRARGARVSLGRVPAQGRPAHRLRDAARPARGEDLGDRRARLQQAGPAAVGGRRGSSSCTPQRPDECCGFGGTFSVFEEPVSAKMGHDKVADHLEAGAEYIVSPDMSCVMHQQGCAQRAGLPLKFIHIAQVLNGARA